MATRKKGEDLLAAAQQDPNNWERWFDLAEYYYVQRDYAGTKANVRKMLSILPKSFDVDISFSHKVAHRFLPLDFIKMVEKEG
jgi:tetratricopeptide (TPR) repeat protein